MVIRKDWERPEFIIECRQRARQSLVLLRNESLSAVNASGTVFPTISEFEKSLVRWGKELSLEAAMALCASYEAMLRTDLLSRVKYKKKDNASIRLRALHKRKERIGSRTGTRRRQASLEEILDEWKEVVGNGLIIGEMKRVFLYRHWLAHGRYWPQRSGLPDPEPEDIFERGQALVSKLSRFGFPMVMSE